MAKINVGLSDKQRKGAVGLLTTLLADEYVLYTKTRNYHWNVTGPHFHDLHKFFESQYEDIDGKIDDLAEFAKTARLKEAPAGKLSAKQMIHDLLDSHEALVRQLRKDIGKAGDDFHAADVADFLTGLAEDHQKMAWMLRATAE